VNLMLIDCLSCIAEEILLNINFSGNHHVHSCVLCCCVYVRTQQLQIQYIMYRVNIGRIDGGVRLRLITRDTDINGYWWRGYRK